MHSNFVPRWRLCVGMSCFLHFVINTAICSNSKFMFYGLAMVPCLISCDQKVHFQNALKLG